MASICNKQHSHNLTFNKTKLEQFIELTDINMKDIWLKNIKELKNIILQTEKYLVMIYELLIACFDQIMNVSNITSTTDCNLMTASMYVKQYINEISLIVGGAQYNGISLLQDTVTAERGFNDVNFAADGSEGTAAYVTDSNIVIEKEVIDGNGYEIQIDNVTELIVGAHVISDSGISYGTIESININDNKITITDNSQINNSENIYITSPILTDKIIYNEILERNNFTIKNIGPGYLSKNNNCKFNIFVFDLPKVGIHSLGLTSFTSISGYDYHILGLENTTDTLNIDKIISDFSNAIKIVIVQINKMNAYRNICKLREKQIKIYENTKKMH